MKLRDHNIIKKDENIVVILTAHGSKFSNSSVEYHNNSSNQFANKTISIQPNIEELEKAINK